MPSDLEAFYRDLRARVLRRTGILVAVSMGPGCVKTPAVV